MTIINQIPKNNEFLLQVKQDNCEEEIKLIVTSQTYGDCFKCKNTKEIRLISERKISTSTYEERKFCWSCALTNLYELEEGNYHLLNKDQIITNLRNELNNCQ